MTNTTALLIKIRRRHPSENITLLALFSMVAAAVSMVIFVQQNNEALYLKQLVNVGVIHDASNIKEMTGFHTLYGTMEEILGLIAGITVFIGYAGGLILIGFRNKNMEKAVTIMRIYGFGKKDAIKKAILDAIFCTMPASVIGCLLGRILFRIFCRRVMRGEVIIPLFGVGLLQAIAVVFLLTSCIVVIGNLFADLSVLNKSIAEHLYERNRWDGKKPMAILLGGGLFILLFQKNFFHIKDRHAITIVCIVLLFAGVLFMLFYLIFGVYATKKRKRMRIQGLKDLSLCFLCERRKRNALLAIVIAVSTAIVCLLANIVMNVSDILRTAYRENMGYTCVIFVEDFSEKDAVRETLSDHGYSFTYGYSGVMDYAELNGMEGTDGKLWGLIIDAQTDDNVYFTVSKGTFMAEAYFANRCNLTDGAEYELFGSPISYIGIIPDCQYMSLISYSFIVNARDYKLPIDEKFKPVFIMDLGTEDEINVKELLAKYHCHVDSASELMEEVVSLLSEYLEILAVMFAMIFLVTITIFYTVIRTDIEKRKNELYLYHVFGASYRNSGMIVYREYILLSLISSLSVSLSVSLLGELFFFNALGIHYALSIAITILTIMFSLVFIMGCCLLASHRVINNAGLEVIRDE